MQGARHGFLLPLISSLGALGAPSVGLSGGLGPGDACPEGHDCALSPGAGENGEPWASGRETLLRVVSFRTLAAFPAAAPFSSFFRGMQPHRAPRWQGSGVGAGSGQGEQTLQLLRAVQQEPKFEPCKAAMSLH